MITEFSRASIENCKTTNENPFANGEYTFSEKRDLTIKGYDRPVFAYEIVF